MLLAARAEVIGIGGATLDFYRPVGQVGPDHIPGAKAPRWTEQDQLTLDALQNDPDVAKHPGGNTMNALAWLALEGERFSHMAFAGVLGVGDHASLAIKSHLERLGIKNLAGEYPGYLPSVSIIERAAPGSDRGVRGRPRTNMEGYMDVAYIQGVTAGARLVLAASLKSAKLTDRVFEHTPQDAFLALNPGSSEFLPTAEGGHPDRLLAAMRRRNPDLLSLNDDELRGLFDAPDAGIESLMESATHFAESVLCTMGTAGMLLSRRLNGGGIEHTHLPITPIVPVDTLGAGDRANAVTINGLVMGYGPDKILAQAAEASAEVIQHVGAHGDLY